MKKIVMILGAVALCCMGLFTSCANDEQDVNIKNWGEMDNGGDYICNVSDIVIAGTGIPTTGIAFSADYGKIRWYNDTSNTNYRDYSISVANLKQTVGTNETEIGSNSYEIRKIGSTYSVIDYYGDIDENVESVTVDPSFESSTFTVKITYKTGKGPNRADSISMKFTRK